MPENANIMPSVESSLVVVGFDLRIDAEKNARDWTQERREQFLLRPDVNALISADETAWPRCPDRALFGALFKHVNMYPEATFNGLDLYDLIDADNLNCMGAQTSFSLVAISFELSESEIVMERHVIDSTINMSLANKNGFRLMGFDVCDPWLLSGMMNCENTPEVRHKLRGEFARHVNGHGLFSDYAVALEFADVIGREIVEHAPFTPVGLSVWERAADVRGRD